MTKIAVDSASIPAADKQILSVGSGEILIWEDISCIFGLIFNREAVIINPPLPLLDRFRSALGLTSLQTEKALGRFRTLLANEFFRTKEEIAKLEAIFNFRLESLESFLRRHLFNLSNL